MPSEFTDPLPGVPFVESPFFEQLLDAKGLSPAERAVAMSLNRDGCAYDNPIDRDVPLGAAHVEYTAMYGDTRESIHSLAAELRYASPWYQPHKQNMA